MRRIQVKTYLARPLCSRTNVANIPSGDLVKACHSAQVFVKLVAQPFVFMCITVEDFYGPGWLWCHCFGFPLEILYLSCYCYTLTLARMQWGLHPQKGKRESGDTPIPFR